MKFHLVLHTNGIYTAGCVWVLTAYCLWLMQSRRLAWTRTATSVTYISSRTNTNTIYWIISNQKIFGYGVSTKLHLTVQNLNDWMAKPRSIGILARLMPIWLSNDASLALVWMVVFKLPNSLFRGCKMWVTCAGKLTQVYSLWYSTNSGVSLAYRLSWKITTGLSR